MSDENEMNEVVPFKINHCGDCGDQALVQDFNGRPINGIVGTVLCWICLCDEDGNVMTRIGSIPFCKDCNIADIDPDKVIQNLIASPGSGLTGDEPELAMFPRKKIEIIKRFGD